MTTETFISEIRELSESYQPGPQTGEHLSETTLVALIGPMAVGKTTCMEALDERHADFGMAHGFTTRPQRSNEAPDIYRFRPHDEDTLVDIADSLRGGELVQAAVHPTTGYVYGTETVDYQHPYTVLDTLHSHVDDIRQLPFGGVQEIGLTTLPGMWWGRVIERIRADSSSGLDKRMREAEASLNWLIDQGESMAWVVNQDDKLEASIDEIADISRGERQPHPSSRQVGKRLLGSVSSYWGRQHSIKAHYSLR